MGYQNSPNSNTNYSNSNQQNSNFNGYNNNNFNNNNNSNWNNNLNNNSNNYNNSGYNNNNFSNSNSNSRTNSTPSYLAGLEVSGPTGIGISNSSSHQSSPNHYQNSNTSTSNVPSYMMGLQTSQNHHSNFQHSPNMHMNSPPPQPNMSGMQYSNGASSNMYSNGSVCPPPSMNYPQPQSTFGPAPTMPNHFPSHPMPLMTGGPSPIYHVQPPTSMPGFPPMNPNLMPPPPMHARGSQNAHIIGGSGKRRALILGINYIHGKRGKLNGCINDAHNMANFMASHFGFREIRLMTDDKPFNSPDHPTKQNIINGIHWLVDDAAPGDSFFFHFSGHGGQSEDKSK